LKEQILVLLKEERRHNACYELYLKDIWQPYSKKNEERLTIYHIQRYDQQNSMFDVHKITTPQLRG